MSKRRPETFRDFLTKIESHGRDRRDVRWVICGGESGPGARPFNPSWARYLRDMSESHGIAFHFKQMGSKPIGVKKLDPKGHDWEGYNDLRVREFPR